MALLFFLNYSQGVWCQVQRWGTFIWKELGEGFTSWSKFYARIMGQKQREKNVEYEELSCQCSWRKKAKNCIGGALLHTKPCVCQWFRLSFLLLLSSTSVTSILQNVTQHHQYMNTKWARSVSPWQQPEDKQFFLMHYPPPPISEWKVKVNPWCLSVNWAYYVSASGCKGRKEEKKEGRKEGKTEFLSLAWPADSALTLLFTN